MVFKVLPNEYQHFDPCIIGGTGPNDDVCCYVYANVSLALTRPQPKTPATRQTHVIRAHRPNTSTQSQRTKNDHRKPARF